ncbi:MAG: DUF4296 domain-containing protein [Bacteroidetes bacterium]|nr:DUF4296 domain-containing protein [Bacteroidota bacterium]
MKLSQIILTGCLTLTLSCNKVPIPLEPLAEIMAEMFVIDQRIQDEPNLSSIADTADVYAAVLKNHRYTPEDFLRSVRYHARNPEKFKKALQQQRDLISAQRTALERQWEKLHQTIDAYPPFPPDSLLSSPSFLRLIAPSFLRFRSPLDTLPPFLFYTPPKQDTTALCAFTK